MTPPTVVNGGKTSSTTLLITTLGNMKNCQRVERQLDRSGCSEWNTTPTDRLSASKLDSWHKDSCKCRALISLFAPIVRRESLRIFLGLIVHQADIVDAYLESLLDDNELPIYMKPPPGINQVRAGMYCWLLKRLYGLKQSRRSWNKSYRVLHWSPRICANKQWCEHPDSSRHKRGHLNSQHLRRRLFHRII